MAITKEQVIDILDKFDFFQGQRAGRELWNDKPYEVQEEDIKDFSRDVAELKAYIADVVPKSEAERLTINMNAYGLTAKRLAEENENLEIELENMRRNLGDAREGWNDAECEAERLRKVLDEYEETSGLKQAKAEVEKIFEEIEEQIDRGLAVITKILNAKGGRANGKTVLLSKYDVFIESKKYIAELKKKYTEVST